MNYLKKTEIPKAMKEFLKTVTTGSPTFNIDLLMKHKSGKTFNGELSGKIYKTKNFKGTTGTIRDITDRKRAEQEILKLKDSLEVQVAQKTKELDEQNKHLQRFNDAMVDRELRMKELYDENEKLKEDLKKKG